MAEKLLGIVISVFIAASLRGQCPDKDALWKRLVYFRDNPRVLPKDQLAELLPVLSKMNNCPNKNDSVYTLLLRRIGANYSLQGDYVRAIQYFRESIKTITENADYPKEKQKDLISAYYFLSVFYASLNNVGEAMKALDSSIACAMRLNVPSDISCVAALYKKVEYLFDVGDYHRCVDYAMMCEKLATEYASHETEKRNTEAGRTTAESSLLWRVKALLVLKEYTQVEGLLNNKVQEYKTSGLENYLGSLYSQLAEVQIHKGNYRQALSLLKTSYNYDQKAGYIFSCKQTLKDIGFNIYFKHLNDGDGALTFYRRALKLYNRDESRKQADHFESLNIFSDIANVYVAKGLYDSAYRYFQLAFDQVKPGSDETAILHSTSSEFLKNKKIHYVTGLFLDKADAYRKQYETEHREQAIEKAIAIYRVTDQLLGRIKAEQIDLESKLFWRSDSRRLYENAIEACYLQRNAADAFYFFEKSRAVLLNDQLTDQHWLSDDNIFKLAQLKRRIQLKKRELENVEPSAIKENKLDGQLLADNQELDQLTKTIQSNNPVYYQNFLDTSTITIKDVRKRILQDHQALVELFAGERSVYSLVITSRQNELTRIDKTAFETAADLFTSYISNPDVLNRNFDAFIATSHQLFRLIFENSSLPAGRIVVSLEGHYFPFEALVTATQPVKYFLTDHAVSYTYSARYLINRFEVKPGPSYNFAGFAPVQYPTRLGLAKLAGSDHSLRKLQSYFRHADIFINAEASRKKFLDEFYRYKVIQLYTHASDSSNAGEPVIWFSDSALYLSDLISDEKPATRLIVLSACETGTGKLYRGEGVFSFNRGFSALGVPSSVNNLWAVSNEATYRLTELFYRNVSKKMPMDVALQKAKMKFIQSGSRDKAMPYYWAGTILVGKTDAIEFRKQYSWKYLIAISIIAGLIAWGHRRLKKRNPATSKKTNMG